MIQYYLEVRKDLGFLNVIASKIDETANMVNLSVLKHPRLSPGKVLEVWSIVIDQDVTGKCLGSIATASSNLSSISCTLNQAACMMGTLQANIYVQ